MLYQIIPSLLRFQIYLVLLIKRVPGGGIPIPVGLGYALQFKTKSLLKFMFWFNSWKVLWTALVRFWLQMTCLQNQLLMYITHHEIKLFLQGFCHLGLKSYKTILSCDGLDSSKAKWDFSLMRQKARTTGVDFKLANTNLHILSPKSPTRFIWTIILGNRWTWVDPNSGSQRIF